MEGIHLVTNGRLTKSELEAISLLQKNADYIHIREKTKTARELATFLSYLEGKEMPKEKIIINDRVDLAHVKKCRGVQLAYHSLSVKEVKSSFPELKVGKSIHSFEEAIVAEKDGADFLMFGHVFPSTSKEGLPPQGLNQLHAITQTVSIPIIAIGGITPQNIRSVLAAGASGVAIMSGIWNSENWSETLKRYRDEYVKWEEEEIAKAF